MQFKLTIYFRVNVGIRRNVYVTGIKRGGVADFDFLDKRLSESNFANDQLEMLRGFGAASVPSLLTR